jgi:predicted amidohydrolase
LSDRGLRLAVAQPPCVAGDVAANAGLHAEAVWLAAARVVVFPELSLTGYELDAPDVDRGDVRLAPIVASCASTGSIVLAGAPVDGANAVLAIDGGGAHLVYRKVFLGGDEPGRFTAGTEPRVLEIDGWRLGLAICKDTGVAEHADATAALGIDIYVAGVLEHAADAHVPEERATRIAAAHGCWVAMASFAAPTGGGYHHPPGGSGIWAPDGTRVADAGPDVGGIATATLTR